MRKLKKYIAVLSLIVMAVSVAAPVSHAAGDVIEGTRQQKGSKYRSHTRVKMYDNNGVPYILTVSSKIHNNEVISRDRGDVLVNTEYKTGIANAYHGYGIGNNVTCNWISN